VQAVRNKTAGPCLEVEGTFQGAVELNKSRGGKRCDEMSEVGFAEAYKVVAHDPALMFQAVIGTNGNLRRQSFAVAKNGSTDNGRESGIDQNLTADDDKDAILFEITTRFVNAIEFTTLHTISGRALFLGRLELQNIRSFEIKTVGSPIETIEISCLQSGFAAIPEVCAKNAFDESRAGLFGASETVNFRKKVFGECD